MADTDAVGYTSASAASGVALKSGWAANEVANDVRRQLNGRDARVWGVPEVGVE